MSLNWNLCALCQKDTKEKILCPEKASNTLLAGSSYKTIAENLKEFEKLDSLPINIPLSSLDDGRGIENTLRNHRASWHKSCYNKCNTLKLQRAQKRKSEEEFSTEDPAILGATSPAKTRRKTFELSSKSSNALSCFSVIAQRVICIKQKPCQLPIMFNQRPRRFKITNC
ncbi:uncharacterized protein LOC124458339 [Xenia sp. Carnegie-2017]|uniref:uncharacterized protein LOC124458339 n=1 Tax=Xenia sp. Carnegie-2017 TaxID=2897299 RepID=UPI001F036CD8|nr:uncharacterized protein LOC124458339 [Xenia sp. Carnegie-2017]